MIAKEEKILKGIQIYLTSKTISLKMREKIQKEIPIFPLAGYKASVVTLSHFWSRFPTPTWLLALSLLPGSCQPLNLTCSLLFPPGMLSIIRGTHRTRQIRPLGFLISETLFGSTFSLSLLGCLKNNSEYFTGITTPGLGLLEKSRGNSVSWHRKMQGIFRQW